jgi:beta-glucosidase
LAVLLLSAASADRPWTNRTLTPDARAALVEARMTLDEKVRLVDGLFGMPASFMPGPPWKQPAGALGSAGFIPGVPRLGIPDLQESDAGIGVADPIDHVNRPIRGVAGYSIALPSGLATAATWNPKVAFAGGAMIGGEAHEEGFNVLLAGGLDLAREPRNGRNFEYAGEDPLLAGTIVGEEIRGIQSRHVVSTTKHYALNDQETRRHAVSADVDWADARESDLLAFEIAIEDGRPGAVMCSYNRVNGVHACGDGYLLNRVLKREWAYPGWVLSDWGAVYGTADAVAGLDQESAYYFDEQNYFGSMLERAVRSGSVPASRLDDMVHRILRSMFANGLFDDPPVITPIDATADAAVAQRDEEQAIVLLQNRGALLPLSKRVRSIAIVGSHADAGVISGGGSSQVWPVGGPAVPASGDDPVVWDPSSPMRAIEREAPGARVRFNSGNDPSRAAQLAAASDVAIVFANQWLEEGADAPNLSLPDEQDRLIARVAAANPHTIVVLETGGPVTMPWLARTAGVMEAWYPGARGGEAIARVLFGEISPSGRLPITFARSEAQLPRPVIDGSHADYRVEGADAGYKWYDRKGISPLFPFGYGLTYSTFRYAHLRANGMRVRFDVTNTGSRRAAEVAQIYATPPSTARWHSKRLVGWQKVDLTPGRTAYVTVTMAPRVLGWFDAAGDVWRVSAGTYRIEAGASERDPQVMTTVVLPPTTARP